MGIVPGHKGAAVLGGAKAVMDEDGRVWRHAIGATKRSKVDRNLILGWLICNVQS